MLDNFPKNERIFENFTVENKTGVENFKNGDDQ